MSKIKVMDDSLANKIAAGEVVEKCVSVVKELVENSVDAGADEIKIEVVEAGTKLIKVIDNGTGMDHDDALMAFQRHATSKLLDEMGLFRISSLGFRGEALPSIASVSEVTLKTSTGDVGTKLKINGGKLISDEASDARRGTEITIKNLFYNTPARLKYLNSIYSELANVCEYVNKMALSYPDKKFTLISDDKVLLNTDGSGNLLNTSLKETALFTLLGSSIPIVLLPGIGACILTSLAAKLRAISFCIESNLLTFVPAFNSNSYWVTDGPI